jgi:hypothetical protein
MVWRVVYLPPSPYHDPLRPRSGNPRGGMDIFGVVTLGLCREPSFPVAKDSAIMAMRKPLAPSDACQRGFQVNNGAIGPSNES